MGPFPQSSESMTMGFVVKVKSLNDPDFIEIGSFTKDSLISEVWKEVGEEFAPNPQRGGDNIPRTLRDEGLKLKWKHDGEWKELTQDYDFKKLGQVFNGDEVHLYLTLPDGGGPGKDNPS